MFVYASVRAHLNMQIYIFFSAQCFKSFSKTKCCIDIKKFLPRYYVFPAVSEIIYIVFKMCYAVILFDRAYDAFLLLAAGASYELLPQTNRLHALT